MTEYKSQTSAKQYLAQGSNAASTPQTFCLD